MKHKVLRDLEKIERKAWADKMNGPAIDASTEYGKVGKNEITWRIAADACSDYRKANGLLGMNWKQINSAV